MHDASKSADSKKILEEPDKDTTKTVANGEEWRVSPEIPDATHRRMAADSLGSAGDAKSGPVTFRLPKGGVSPMEARQTRQYVAGCRKALIDGALSPTGRVSTSGELRAQASAAAREEARRAAAAGTPYAGNVGHVPDTTWVGKPNPPSWQDLTERVNKSLGAQSRKYPIGYKPTDFVLEEGDA